MDSHRFNVFGHIYLIERAAGVWQAWSIGADGKRSPAGFVVPAAAVVLAWALLASPAAAAAAGRCPVPGEPLHWIADYCMLTLQTDDEIAASSCIEQQGQRRFRDPCASNTYFKKRMCEVMVRSGTRSGTVDQCLRDPSFKGRTVERGGVGG